MNTKFNRFQHDARCTVLSIVKYLVVYCALFLSVSFHKISPKTFASMWSIFSVTVLTNRGEYFTLHTYRVSFRISALSLFFVVVKILGSGHWLNQRAENVSIASDEGNLNKKFFCFFFVCKFKFNSNLHVTTCSMFYTWLTLEISQICVFSLVNLSSCLPLLGP